MKLTISRQSLLRELTRLRGVVERKNTIPILSNVLLEAAPGALTLRGTDLDVSVTTACEAEVARPGAVCVGAKKLFEIARALPDAPIEIAAENWQVSVKCERSRFKLPGLSPESYPEIPQPEGAFVALPAALLRDFINRVSFAITQEESRYALNGAKLEIAGGALRMVATDGHRLSLVGKRGAVSDASLTADILIPRKALAEMAALCDGAGTVELSHAGNHVSLRSGSRTLTARLLTGQFPNYAAVLPAETPNRAVLDAAGFAAAVRRVALMADERSQAVRLDFRADSISVAAQSAEAGEAGETVACEYAGAEATACYNARYLSDFFGAVPEGRVIFEFRDGNSQAQLRPEDGEGCEFKMILMPMRI